jgi:hypothetical protein
MILHLIDAVLYAYMDLGGLYTLTWSVNKFHHAYVNPKAYRRRNQHAVP